MSHLKRSIVEVKAEDYSLAHALIIAIPKVDNPNYTYFRVGRKISPVVRSILVKTVMDLSGGGGISEIIKFQEHFREY